MPRTEEQNKLIKDRRRAKIVRAAIRVFSEKGYDKVAVDDITKAAKCSHGLFYHYFESKAEIMIAIFNEIIVPGDYLPPCKKALEARSLAGIKMMMNYFEKTWNAGPSIFNVSSLACQLNVIAAVPEELQTLARDYNVKKTFETLIAQGQQERKIIPGDPAEIALGITDITTANFLRLIFKGKKTPIVSSDVIYGMMLINERVD